MAIVGFASTAGSAGVTTTAIAAAFEWPRPVLFIEADTSNVSAVLPGLFRGRLDYSRSLSQAMLLHTRSRLTADAFLDAALPLALAVHDLPDDPYLPHPTVPSGHRLWVVPGFDNVEAAAGTGSLWDALAAVGVELEALGVDMMVDFGRFARDESRQGLVVACDRLVIVARATLPDLFRSINRLPELTARFAAVGREPHVKILLIAAAPGTADAHDFATQTGVGVVGVLPFAPRSAAAFSGGTPDRRRRSPYLRSIRKIVRELSDPLIQDHRTRTADKTGASHD